MSRGPLLRLGDPLFRSRRACRALFHLDPAPGEGDRLDHDAFDLATLALRRGLAAWLPPGVGVVEVGTGPTPVLTGWLHHRGHPVVGWEAHPESAARARAALQRAHGAAAPVVHAAAFDRHSPIDAPWLVANPPYVPTARGAALGLDPARPHAWDGGPDGLQACRDLGEALRGRFSGVLVLGGNHLFHRPCRVARVLQARVEDQVGCGPGWAVRLRLR